MFAADRCPNSSLPLPRASHADGCWGHSLYAREVSTSVVDKKTSPQGIHQESLPQVLKKKRGTAQTPRGQPRKWPKGTGHVSTASVREGTQGPILS